jgi:hypothetical protein
MVPELSGPSASFDGSTPVTVNELEFKAPDAGPPAPPPEPPDAPLPAEMVPDSLTSFRTKAPTAAETSFWPDTVVTADDLSVPRPPPTSMSRLTLVDFWLDCPELPLKLKLCPLQNLPSGAG